jgi:negative regulator of replication initiation
MTQAAKEQFSDITNKALRRFLNEKINERLKQALEDSEEPRPTPAEVVEMDPDEEGLEIGESVVRVDKSRGIVTTEDEIEGLFAIKSILRKMIDAKRVHMRDTKSYCGILLDDNNRKPICRLRFDQDQKYLGLFDEHKKEERIPVDDVDDIYNYAVRIMATVNGYDNQHGIPVQKEDLEKQDVIQGRNVNYTGKKLLAVHFQGRRCSVGSWKEGMFKIIEALRVQDPATFEATAPTMKGKKRPYITTDGPQLRSAGKIPNTPYYIETNLGAWGITKLCFDLAVKMGLDESDLAFETA